MKLSNESRERLEDFFREANAPDISLSDVEVYARGGARIITSLFRVSGITFGRFIFVDPKAASRNDQNRLCISRELIAHEIAHVLQYRREGFLRFLFTYLRNYLRIFRNEKKWNLGAHVAAYFRIPHEIEAREFAENFLRWSDRKKVERAATE